MFHTSFNYETFYAVDFFTLSRTGVCYNFNTDKDFLDLETLDDVTLCFQNARLKI